MDEDALQKKWAELVGQDPAGSEHDPTATYRMPPPAGSSSAGSGPERPWDTLVSLSESGEVDGQSPTLHTPPPDPAAPPGSAPASDSAIGPTSSGPTSFELREVIGRGGMGVVFRALQTSLQREVAVKKLHRSLGSSSHESRFVAEAMVAGLLDHPNVVPVHELGRTGRGELLIAMKLARGPSWKRLLAPTTDEERERAASMDRRAHLEVLLAVCNAVAYAHTKGVAHLDLKPENVLVGEFGEVLVMDWGLAVALDPALVRPGLPHHAAVSAPCGTPAYMPPELAEGDGKRIGAWTDTYLLGATLHELVTGKPPHKGKNVADTVLAAIRATEPPEYGPEVPAELRAILRRALQPRPADRYPSATALRDALAEHLRHAESTRVADEARRALEATRAPSTPEPGADDEQGRAARYGSFADAVAGFRHARVLWAGNEDARRGEAEARRAYATAALAAGDLGLAATQASALRALAPGAGESAEADDLALRVRAATDARASAARAAWRARAGLAAALTTIVVGLAVGLGLLDRSRRRAEQEEARAREQEALAVDRAAEAQAARAEMERRLADSLLAEGRALGAGARYDAARARLAQARGLLVEQRRPVLPADLTLLQTWHEAPEALLTLAGDGAVTAVALAEEADVVVVGTAAGRLRVVARRSGRVVHDVEAHAGAVLTLDASLDGRRAVSGGADGAVRVWDLSAGRELATLTGHAAPVRAVALARHAEVAVSGGDDQTLRAWDLAAKVETAKLAHAAPVVAVAVSWNGEFAATGAGRTVRVVHVGAGSTLETHDAHEGPVTCVALGGNYVLSGGADQRVISSNIRGISRTVLVGHAGVVRRVAFEDEDDARVLTAADDGTLRRWEVAYETTQAKEVGRRAVPPFSAVALDPELGRVATGHADGALRVHDLTRGLPGGREALDLAGPPARAVGVDAAGELVVAATEGGAARVWDAASGRPLAELAGHAGGLVAIDVARPTPARDRSAGPRGLTAGEDGVLILWDLARGLPLRRLATTTGPRCARLTADAERVVTGDRDGLVRVTTLADGAEVARLDGHTGPVNAVALGGALVASGGEDGAVRAGPLAGPTGELRLVGRHEAPLRCVALSSDDRLLVSGASDGTLRAWDVNAAGGTARWEVLAHAGPVVGVAIVTDVAGAKLVVSAGADGALIVRDPVTGADLAALPSAGLVHSLAVSPDGLRVVLGGAAGARLWDVSRVARRDRLRPAVASPALDARAAWSAFVGANDDAALLLHEARDAGQARPSTDGALLATQWSREHLVDAARVAERLVAAAPGDPLAAARLEAVRLQAGESGAKVAQELDILRALAFTPDGARLVTTSRAADVTVWHAGAGVALRRMRHGTARDLGAFALLDSRRAATGGADGVVLVWDLDTGDPLARFSAGDKDVSEVVALPDGRVLAAGEDGVVREWSLADPSAPPRVVVTLDEAVRALALSPDGRRLALAGRDPAVRLFDFPSGTPLGALDGATTTIHDLEFLPDGRLLATSGRTLLCWAAEPTTGDGHPLEGHESSIYALAITPDGRRAATGGSDGVRLWDLSRGIELRFVALDGLPLGLAWSPDGAVLAIGLRDGEVRLVLAPP